MDAAFPSLPWLLDPSDPGVRYLALRDLVHPSPSEFELAAPRQAAHTQGPIAALLDHMQPEGFWHSPGPGYNPKYFSTVWSVLALAQLGASVQEDERISTACRYLMEHALAIGGQFSISGAPSSTIDCLQGNLCWALTELGFTDPRLELAFDWLARSVTGEGIAPNTDRKAERRYYSGKCGPGFLCGANNKLPCAWGAVKVMLALGQVPPAQRTPMVNEAIQMGVDFLIGIDPATAAYPTGYADKPSGNWWKFGFPVFYITDLLQLVEALVRLGYGADPRLGNALDLIRKKADASGRWALEFDYTGKMNLEFGVKKAPNKWVTLRALRILSAG